MGNIYEASVGRDDPNNPLVPSGALARLIINSPEFKNTLAYAAMAHNKMPRTLVVMTPFNEESGKVAGPQRGLPASVDVGYGREALKADPRHSMPYPMPAGNILGHEVGHLLAEHNGATERLYPSSRDPRDVSGELIADLLGGLPPTRENYYGHEVTPDILGQAKAIIAKYLGVGK